MLRIPVMPSVLDFSPSIVIIRTIIIIQCPSHAACYAKCLLAVICFSSDVL